MLLTNLLASVSQDDTSGVSWIRVVSYEESTGELRRLYDIVKGASGNVDNVVKVHSSRPHTLEGHYALDKSVLHHPDIEDRESRMSVVIRSSCCPSGYGSAAQRDPGKRSSTRTNETRLLKRPHEGGDREASLRLWAIFAPATATLPDELRDDLPVYVGQAIVSSLEAIGELFVVDPQEV